MSKLPLDDLLVFSRKTILTAINRALAAKRPVLVLDGTAGNGVDTEFLARAVEEEGRVLAFDVQEAALAKTEQRLAASGPENLSRRVRLIRDGHEHLQFYLEPGQQITAAMYNLGFLPGGAADVTTTPGNTLASLRQLVERTAPGGVISVHCYTGQEHGPEEAEAVRVWAEGLPWADWRALGYDFCNKAANREFLYLACRLDLS
jgi:predicted methyltransferase